jgi:hypothetical protein
MPIALLQKGERQLDNLYALGRHADHLAEDRDPRVPVEGRMQQMAVPVSALCCCDHVEGD